MGVSMFNLGYAAVDSGLKNPSGPGTSESNYLVRCGNNDSAECGYADLVKLVQNILNLIFALTGFIAAAMFMYAGFLYLTAMGNISQIQKAHGIFRKVLIGFLILFMSFILVQQLLKNLNLSRPAQQAINGVVEVPN